MDIASMSALGKLRLPTFHWTHGIGLVNDDNIDVVQLQALQAGSHALDDVFAWEASLLGSVEDIKHRDNHWSLLIVRSSGHSLGAPVHFGSDHIGGALPAGTLQYLSDLRFGVRLRDVKEIDAAVDGQLQYGLGLLIADARREDRPSPQADVRDAQAALAQILVPQARRRRRAVPQRQRRIRAEAYWTAYDGNQSVQRAISLSGFGYGLGAVSMRREIISLLADSITKEKQRHKTIEPKQNTCNNQQIEELKLGNPTTFRAQELLANKIIGNTFI